MNAVARTLLLISALWAGVAGAAAPGALTEQDWVDAAWVSLAKVERKQQAILVLDDSLPPAARDAMKQLRKTVAEDELPERDKYELPPGGYVIVRQFEAHGDSFEFRGTRGTIPRNAGLNCGVTLHFFVLRGPDGAWKPDDRMQVTVC
jgi:hypothetical protein